VTDSSPSSAAASAARSFEAETFSGLGTPRPAVPLPPTLFDGTVNIPVMHQAVKAFLANQRQGNAATKIRKFVTGGNQKPWKQKGTGRARQGSIRAPQWVGGGTVFGPTPRSYAQYVPRQVRALARKSALNARAREGAVKVIDAFRYEAPHTRRLLQLLQALGVADQKVLVLTDGAQPNVYLSGRNLPAVHVIPYADVSTYHVLWSDVVLIEASAIGHTLEPLAERAPPAPARQTPRASAPARAAAAPAAGRPAKKQAAAAKPPRDRAPKRARKSATPRADAATKRAAKPGRSTGGASKPAARKKTTPKKKGK
jgi:large subunit ribosomal protein L4